MLRIFITTEGKRLSGAAKSFFATICYRSSHPGGKCFSINALKRFVLRIFLKRRRKKTGEESRVHFVAVVAGLVVLEPHCLQPRR